MDTPISSDQNRFTDNRNPNPNAGDRSHTPPNPADDRDQKLHHLFSSIQNLAVSRDSSDGGRSNPVSVDSLPSSFSRQRPLQTDFFREVSLFNAHFSSEPDEESSRWAQFLPEYLRPGNSETYLEQTDKPQLFGDNYWWVSEEISGQDCNSRLAAENQGKMPEVKDGQKDLQSSKPRSQANDHIQYSRDQLLQFREVISVSESILKIKQEIEVKFLGVNQIIEHGATLVGHSGARKESGSTSKEKEEEKKVASIPVNAKEEPKIGDKANQEEVPKKKKRGMSDEKKAKRKMKERRKRAEKNRKLGVHRLKIPPPIQKQKSVSHCRHYINGRCYEGETCKFSHDVVPWTKTKPCCHFARQACMKGDDCPFDHQLSKYPCNNFESGFCNRAERCLFSHEIKPEQDSASIQLIKSPSTLETGSVNKPAQERKGLSSGNFPFGTSTNHNLATLVSKADTPTSNGTSKGSPASANESVTPPKGFTFFNLGKLPPNDSANGVQASQKTSNGVEAGVLSNQGTISNVSNQFKISDNHGVKQHSISPNFSSWVASAGDKKDSSRALTDIFTFGRSSSDNHGEKKQPSFPTCGNSSMIASAGDNKDSSRALTDIFTFGRSSSDNHGEKKQPSFPTYGNSSMIASAGDNKDSSRPLTDIFALGRSSPDNHGEKKQPSFPTFGSSLVASAGDKKDSVDTNQKPNVVPFMFPASKSSSTPFLTGSDNAQGKNTFSSGKRSLLSTLGFATKLDSGGSPMNVNPCVGTSASSGDNKNPVSSSGGSTGPKEPANPFEMWTMLWRK